MDTIASKTMSVKESGETKLQELANKAEEVVKQVCFFLSCLNSKYKCQLSDPKCFFLYSFYLV